VADVSVRAARAEEAGAIARIQRDTLTLAYERLFPPDLLAELADPANVTAITASIAAAIADPNGRVLVALDAERVVGFAFARPATTDGETVLESADTDGDHTGFLEQILVEPRWGRRGHGSRLLAAAVDWLTETGRHRVITWVPEQNKPTVDFLTSAGWAPDGYTRGFEAGGTAVREVRFHTAL
jgi:GNAT superfamily N-acetyltransferase